MYKGDISRLVVLVVMQFDFIASTGRTATTFLAATLNSVDGIAACHEGYIGAEKGAKPLLPLINLENAQAYGKPKMAANIVAQKRNAKIFAELAILPNVNRLIDVAYYNSTIASEILNQNPQSRMIGIVRECGAFVRSSTTILGEDPLPVGWPDASKELSDREKFIAMGRIRPRRGSDEKAAWDDWSAIEKNIWLWRETNLLLADAQSEFPDRVRICRFETIKAMPDQFWSEMAGFLELPSTDKMPKAADKSKQNQKPSGYQIPNSKEWAPQEQDALINAQRVVDRGLKYDW
ncbi:hypothetical protein [uncultured Roseovarius sp.]|uniref:hypothetical protein n=1 Tax=uncultured Roseovarius sp. TaxID=293344 RepID=UPI0026283EF9|nr:hypothetical protein [uncultured Roseovarius sp.]